ncbi:ATP-binding protein [Streptomyces sp. NPDC058255]|uniref:ATP-binding protein n=1 Tax=Streptomyces sp. NPDC058255 TaxID=3346407 RepID=UPI0036E42F33
MTAAAYQYVDLPDASVVTTRALLTARDNITDTVAARAMMCLHGGAGFGKTLAVNICLREREAHEDVRRVTFRAWPNAPAPSSWMRPSGSTGRRSNTSATCGTNPSPSSRSSSLAARAATLLRREAMLASRIFIWQHLTRLTPSEVLETIPLFHPVWADADPDDIAFADYRAAHGNFRAWARLTAHTRTALTRTGHPRVDQELLRWAFSRLD